MVTAFFISLFFLIASSSGLSKALAVDLSDTKGPEIVSFSLSSEIQVEGFARYVVVVKDDKNFVKVADRISFPNFQLRNLSSRIHSPICTPSWAQWWYPIFEFKEDLNRKPTTPASNHYFFLTVRTNLPAYTYESQRIPDACASFSDVYALEDWYGDLFKDEAGNITQSRFPLINGIRVTKDPALCLPMVNIASNSYYPPWLKKTSWNSITQLNLLLDSVIIGENARLRGIGEYARAGQSLLVLRQKGSSPSEVLTNNDLQNWNMHCARTTPIEISDNAGESLIEKDISYVNQVKTEQQILVQKAKAEAEAKAKAEAEAKAKAEAEANANYELVLNQYKLMMERIRLLKIKYPKESSLPGLETKMMNLPIIKGSDLTSAIYNINSVNSKLDSSEKVWAKTQKTAIICVKGKLTKKVTAINPKCPAGYMKK